MVRRRNKGGAMLALRECVAESVPAVVPCHEATFAVSRASFGPASPALAANQRERERVESHSTVTAERRWGWWQREIQ